MSHGADSFGPRFHDPSKFDWKGLSGGRGFFAGGSREEEVVDDLSGEAASSEDTTHGRGEAGVDTWVVVPCFNEASRLDLGAFESYAQRHRWVGFVFVNDGSTDATAEMLRGLVSRLGEQGGGVELSENRGKGEAVRVGLQVAVDGRARYLGYWDADLATPLDAIDEFRRQLNRREDIEWVLGSRMPLLGRRIERQRFRAWLGRRFALAASWLLGVSVYDSQCGAKLLRQSPVLESILSQPFQSRWIFDVELLLRYRQQLVGRSGAAVGCGDLMARVFELPLDTWSEIAGSKVRPRDFVSAGHELLSLAWRYRRWGNIDHGSARRDWSYGYRTYGGLLHPGSGSMQSSGANDQRRAA